jgi:hypothetical protein
MTGSRRADVFGPLLGVALLACSSNVSAQAWLPGAGEGAVSVLYQNSLVDRHLGSDGSRIDSGTIRVDGLLLDVTYGVTEKIALTLNVPFLAAKYEGVKPHPNSPIDDGRLHGAFQDLRFDVRYNVVTAPFAITPFVATVLPSHDYQYYGHAAVGRDLNEVQVGAYVARVLDPFIPGAFVQGRYAYGFTQQLFDISHNRSMLDLELGYFVSPKLRTFGLATGQITHGGVELIGAFPFNLPTEQIVHHDQISRVNMLDLGGGAQLSLTPSMDVFGSVLHTMSGTNGHALSYLVTVGASWTFHANAMRRTRAEHSLIRCLCEKGK